MITGEIKNKTDNIWQKLQAAGMANPLTCIEQLSYLMFIRSLDDIEIETEQKENMMGIKGIIFLMKPGRNSAGASLKILALMKSFL